MLGIYRVAAWLVASRAVLSSTELLLINLYQQNKTNFVPFSSHANYSDRATAARRQISVPRRSVLGPLLYRVYTADLPTSTESTPATFTDDTAVLATEGDPGIASQNKQKQTPWPLVRERTIPIERPPLVDEI
jgi:hypothetical protein